MKIALYKGISRVSRCIQWITRSEYSHAAFYFDAPASEAAAHMKMTGSFGMSKLKFSNVGAVVEAWDGVGVRNVESVNDQHTPGTKVDVFNVRPTLTQLQEAMLIAAILPKLGEPYDWKNCLLCDPLLRAVLSLPVLRIAANLIWDEEAWFCSELVHCVFNRAEYRLLTRVQSEYVSPRDVSISPLLQLSEVFITT